MSAVLEKSYTEKAFRYDIETYHKLSATGILPRNTTYGLDEKLTIPLTNKSISLSEII